LYPTWFETFFDGLALQMWRSAVTPEQTAREAAFLAERLHLTPGTCALDVPCGNGRHAIELARRGIAMTGVDLSAGFLAEARAADSSLEWVHGDMRALPWAERFDAAYCWGNSFSYFDPGECQRFLDAVARVLKPGGRFALESGAVSETLLPVLQPERTLRLGALDFHSSNVYDAAEGRMDITYTFAVGDRREVKHAHQWVLSAAEIGRMLRRAGFDSVDCLGDLDGAVYALRSPRLIAIARRPALL
jgi:SAM-dependent methyltransferase